MYLDLESLDELLDMYKDREGMPSVFVGQENVKFENSVEMVAVVTVRCLDYDDDTIIRFRESCGITNIPQEEYSREEETKLIYKRQKDGWELLKKAVEEKKKEFGKILEKAGFTVRKGIWVLE